MAKFSQTTRVLLAVTPIVEFLDYYLTYNSGNQSRPQVVFAPLQKIPKKTAKHDARQGTIDQDPEYLSFLGILESGAPLQAASTLPSISASVNALGDAARPDEKPTSTPLIEYIRAQKAAGISANEKAAKKDKDQRREKRAADRKSKATGKSAAEKEKEKEKSVRVEKVVKLAVRVANSEIAAAAIRKAKTLETPNTPTPVKVAAATLDVTKPPTPQATSISTKNPKRERGSAAVAAAILQRDLGLGGPLQRKDRRGVIQQAVPSNNSSELTSDEAITKSVKPGPLPVLEIKPGEGSQPPQKSRRSRGRNRGGQGGQSNTGTDAAPLSKAPISILKKQGSSAGGDGPGAGPATPPQILKRDIPAAPSPSLATPISQLSATPASPASTAQSPQAPLHGPKGGRGRPSQSGTTNTGLENRAKNISAIDGNDAQMSARLASGSNPTTPSNSHPPPTVVQESFTTNSGGGPGVTPSGLVVTGDYVGGGQGSRGGRGGYWAHRGPRGGGFPPRGPGRGGRGRGGGGRGGRGGSQGGNAA